MHLIKFRSHLIQLCLFKTVHFLPLTGLRSFFGKASRRTGVGGSQESLIRVTDTPNGMKKTDLDNGQNFEMHAFYNLCWLITFRLDRGKSVISVSFLGYLSCLVFSELAGFGGFVSDMNSETLPVFFSSISSVPFFSFWYSHYTRATPFVIVMQSLDIVFLRLLFVFQFWRFLLRYPQAHRFFLSCV